MSGKIAFNRLPLLIGGLLILSLLSACGFHLRSAYQLPAAMQMTYIEAPRPESEFVRALKRGLRASGIQLVNQGSDNAAVFSLLKENRSKRIVSVDARGRAREYTLSYKIVFKISAPDSDFHIKEQQVQIERDFVFDTEDVLGNSREESRMYAEMQQDLVRLVLLRLQSMKAHEGTH